MPTRTIILLILLSGIAAGSLYIWAQPPPTLTIVISQDGMVTLNKEPVSVDELGNFVEQALEEDPLTNVVIKAAPNMPADLVVRVAQEVEQAGASIDLTSTLFPE